MKPQDIIIELFDRFHFGEKSRDTEEVDIRRQIMVALAGNLNSIQELTPRLVQLSELATQKPTQPAVVLSTVHSAKGQEYDSVIIMDMVDHVFPKVSFVDVASPQLCEERNLAYVAVTRAKKKLMVLTYPDRSSLFADEMRNILHSPKEALAPVKELPQTLTVSENQPAQTPPPPPKKSMNEQLSAQYPEAPSQPVVWQQKRVYQCIHCKEWKTDDQFVEFGGDGNDSATGVCEICHQKGKLTRREQENQDIWKLINGNNI